MSAVIRKANTGFLLITFSSHHSVMYNHNTVNKLLSTGMRCSMLIDDKHRLLYVKATIGT
jgi:hypothetical protein